MGAQHEAGLGGLDEEGVLHLAGRVVGSEVQRVEVQPLGFDLGAFGDLPAVADEVVGDALLDELQRMAGTASAARRGQGDVDRLGDEHLGVALLFERGQACVVSLLHLSAGLADELSGSCLLGLVERADLPVRQRQRRFVAHVGQAGGLELIEVRGGIERRQRGLNGGDDGGLIARFDWRRHLPSFC